MVYIKDTKNPPKNVKEFKDIVRSKPSSDKYRENYDKIFRKKKELQ